MSGKRAGGGGGSCRVLVEEDTLLTVMPKWR